MSEREIPPFHIREGIRLDLQNARELPDDELIYHLKIDIRYLLKVLGWEDDGETQGLVPTDSP